MSVYHGVSTHEICIEKTSEKTIKSQSIWQGFPIKASYWLAVLDSKKFCFRILLGYWKASTNGRCPKKILDSRWFKQQTNWGSKNLISDLPIKTSIHEELSISMFNYQNVIQEIQKHFAENTYRFLKGQPPDSYTLDEIGWCSVFCHHIKYF